MTDRFKDALDAITMAMAKDTTTPKKIVRDVFTTHMLLKNIFVINEALTIATEAEQLRKERDELARLVRKIYIEGCWDDESWIFAKKVSEENENA